MRDLIVKNGLVVFHDEVRKLDLAIRGGKFALFGLDLETEEGRSVDADGKYVFPGVVDAHVHFNDPGLPEREDMLTGTSAAAAGGVTTVFDMPLSGNPTVTSVETLECKKNSVREKAVVDYALWAGLVTDNTSRMREIDAAGAIAFKAFTCDAGDDFPYATTATLYKGMLESLRTNAGGGSLIGVHCEDQNLITAFEAERAGDASIRAFLDCHAPITEIAATGMVLRLAEETGARVHICHASLPRVVEMVDRARGRGVRAMVETSPHYLLFSEDDFEDQNAFLKCTPPVRTKKDREDLWSKVTDGRIDMIASDHSPSTIAQKQPASGNFHDAWGGINGVQTMLSVLYSEGVLRRKLDVAVLCRLLCENPARIFGIYPRKGAIRIGSDADFVVFDPAKQWTVSPESLFYKNKQTPYMNMTLRGRVESTYVRGEKVYDDGEITGQPGYGKLIAREQA